MAAIGSTIPGLNQAKSVDDFQNSISLDPFNHQEMKAQIEQTKAENRALCERVQVMTTQFECLQAENQSLNRLFQLVMAQNQRLIAENQRWCDTAEVAVAQIARESEELQLTIENQRLQNLRREELLVRRPQPCFVERVFERVFAGIHRCMNAGGD